MCPALLEAAGRSHLSRDSSPIPAGSKARDGQRDGLSPRLGAVRARHFSTKPVLPLSPQSWPAWDEGVRQVQVPCHTVPCHAVLCCAMPCCAMPCFTWWCQQAMVFQGILLMLQILTGLNAVELICFPGYHSPQQGIINADQSHVILHTIRLQFNLCCPLPSHLIPPCCGPHSLGQD